MGYFPNGTEGMMYEERYCSKCGHGMDNDTLDGGCAVWCAHFMHNYEEANKDNSILHLLIPIDEKGNNLKCEMFYDRRIYGDCNTPLLPFEEKDNA